MDKISDKLDPHKLKLLKHKLFWVMDKLENEVKQRFSAQELTIYLIENVGIRVTRPGVEYALKSDTKAVHKNIYGYRLMKDGQDQLSQGLSKNLIYIEPDKPYKGKRAAVEDLFLCLKGEVKICDPYCGNALLNLLYNNLNKKNPIKILTKQILDKPPGSFSAAIEDLRREGYKINVKIYSSSILHDRYIIDEKNAWLSGNSFNDLGNKESFIINLGFDIRQSILATFNSRWKSIK